MITGSPNPGELTDSLQASGLPDTRRDMNTERRLEADYVRRRLIDNRTLIRLSCALATLVLALRAAEQIAGGTTDIALISLACVLLGSITLTSLALSPAFERLYLPSAQIIVPVRNVIIAAHMGHVATLGQPEMLMVMPLLLFGPFFFLGLGFRAALLSGVVTLIAFFVSVTWFEVPVAVMVRVCAVLLVTLVGCAVAARHVEQKSRAAFVQAREVAELVQQDALTGTSNRRTFDQHLATLWPKAVEARESIALLLIDVDHFKAYNDRYGHQAGDVALRRIAQALGCCVDRPSDVVARYGGEEFAAVLYGTDARRASEIAERMRAAVERLDIEHRGSSPAMRATVSIGVAAIQPSRQRNAQGALQLADEALYAAKTKGRNRIELMTQAQYRLLATGTFSTHALRAGNA